MGSVLRLVKGYAGGLILFGLLSVTGSLVLRFTPFPENWSFGWLLGSMAVVCLFMGVYLAGYWQKGGLVIGLCAAIVLILLILLMVSSAFSALPRFSMLTPWYLIPAAFGMLGGILGANRKKG